MTRANSGICVPGQAHRVAEAVDPLVVVHDPGERLVEELDLADDLEAPHRVQLDRGELVLGQAAGLLQHRSARRACRRRAACRRSAARRPGPRACRCRGRSSPTRRTPARCGRGCRGPWSRRLAIRVRTVRSYARCSSAYCANAQRATNSGSSSSSAAAGPTSGAWVRPEHREQETEEAVAEVAGRRIAPSCPGRRRAAGPAWCEADDRPRRGAVDDAVARARPTKGRTRTRGSCRREISGAAAEQRDRRSPRPRPPGSAEHGSVEEALDQGGCVVVCEGGCPGDEDGAPDADQRDGGDGDDRARARWSACRELPRARASSLTR